MRALTEQEAQTLFAKLAGYTGTSLKSLIDNGQDSDRYVFRMHQNRVYYVRLALANLAVSVSRDKLLSLGTCLGITLCPYLT
ncbi:60S ribosome subunit biogenesis protein NIP7-like protein [Lachnellula suecica]|uniref:60S ribosome subunit biogenesis protein NIP7-like protein n=1 Tax=Lachnellula suecica TaxID=602035 RepID=A0A8T9C4E5_9HELO|nr:60S ribosome subunit biogenesis protein NIP7-like protein [Lachnellula suecica]